MAHGRDNETRYPTVSQHCWDLLVVTTQGSLSLGKSPTVTTCNKGSFNTNIIFSDNLLRDASRGAPRGGADPRGLHNRRDGH